MLIITRNSALKKALLDIIASADSILSRTLNKAQTVIDKTAELDALNTQITTLKIEKSKIEENFAKREREIDHKIGLERKRQEFEVSAATREALVKVREENLNLDKTRFAEEMKFQRERFTTEVDYLKGMIGQVLERLPDARILGSIKVGSDKKE